ncbi:hypothetical protein Efla_001426 [Eimeria flavescens]
MQNTSEATAAHIFSSVEAVDTSWGSAFAGTLLMIICSELGDKTFLITALLSMRCSSSGEGAARGGSSKGSRWHVFAGGFLALALMTVVAAAGGRLLPLVLHERLRLLFMVSLLFFFGCRMLYEAATHQEDPKETGKQTAGSRS